MNRKYGTANCIVCGRPVVSHRGHVKAKEKMALGNLIDVPVLAGFCSSEDCLEKVKSDINGCYGYYKPSFGLIENIFKKYETTDEAADNR